MKIVFEEPADVIEKARLAFLTVVMDFRERRKTGEKFMRCTLHIIEIEDL